VRRDDARRRRVPERLADRDDRGSTDLLRDAGADGDAHADAIDSRRDLERNGDDAAADVVTGADDAVAFSTSGQRSGGARFVF
jgi:hypothetical protein